MIKKIKRIFPVIGAVVLLFGFANTSSAATVAKSDFKIDSLTELKDAIKQADTEAEVQATYAKSSRSLSDTKRAIYYNTKPEVIEEYNEALVNDLKEIDYKLDVNTELSNDSKKVYDLPNSGAQVVIETESSSSDKSGVQSFAVQSKAAQSKSFGNHDYKIKYKITAYLYPDSTAGLLTRYKVAKNGLTAITSSTAGTLGIVPTSILSSSKITDDRAEKVGYDINAQGDYKVTIVGYNGIGLLSYDMSIISTVLWNFEGVTVQSVWENYEVIKDL